MKKQRVITGILAGSVMLVIILDSKTALSGMQEGIRLCMQTIIPSLFPFFLLSGLITTSMLGQNMGLLRHLGKLCKIPVGSESLLVTGFLSGYPVGAQLVSRAYKDGNLTKDDAAHMMGFCSNAGPAFLFGMLSPMFHNPLAPWILWLIHIIGALSAAYLLPTKTSQSSIQLKAKTTTITDALQGAIRSMALVCGWIVIFRVILAFCNRWFLWAFPAAIQVLLSGTLELSNGCILLNKIPQEGLRFILASFMLSFGGSCVLMQTKSVTHELGLGQYFPGKAIQTLMSTVLSCITQYALFNSENIFPVHTSFLCALIIATAIVIYITRKKL